MVTHHLAKYPVRGECPLLKDLAEIDIERHLMRQEVEQVHAEVQRLRELLQEKAARRMPQAVLNIVQIGPGNPASLFGLD